MEAPACHPPNRYSPRNMLKMKFLQDLEVARPRRLPVSPTILKDFHARTDRSRHLLASPFKVLKYETLASNSRVGRGKERMGVGRGEGATRAGFYVSPLNSHPHHSILRTPIPVAGFVRGCCNFSKGIRVARADLPWVWRQDPVYRRLARNTNEREKKCSRHHRARK